MKIIRSRAELFEWRTAFISTKPLAFVPTMGALHLGHQSLMDTAIRQRNSLIVSIYVNPTQFNSPDDLAKYPVTLEADLEMCKAAGAAAVFLPQYEDLYPDHYRYQVVESDDSKILCGQFRPGHFNGVLTVVLRLFQLVRPERAYFGEKDFQQLHLIRGMAEAFFFKIEVLGVPTLREADGLAMSSRNVRLSAEERRKAPLLHQALQATVSQKISLEAARQQLAAEGFKVEYFEDHWNRRLVAAQLGQVRLIDNIPLKEGL